MAAKNTGALPSVEQVRLAFAYWPDTGELRWRWREDLSNNRNAVFAGRVVGRVTRYGYLQATWRGRGHQVHRLAWTIYHGYWPPAEIDHINGVTNDNRIANLRLASRQQNTWNTPARKGSISGLKGVTWNTHNSKWEASIRRAGKRIYLGLFATPEHAHEAYLRAAVAIRGSETVRYDPNRGGLDPAATEKPPS